MTAVSLSTISAILERKYGKGVSMIGLGKESPLWSILPKYTDFTEETYTLRNRYGKIPSGSRTFSVSRSRSGASPFGAFQMTRARDYSTLQFEMETLKAASSDARRLVSYLSLETDSTMEKEALRLNHSAYRNAGGAIGQVASGGATQTITVVDRTVLSQVYPGMYLVSSNTDGTSGSVDANATQVSAVNRTAGTITTAAASWDAITGFSDNDYFFAEGDFGAAFFGLDAWVPSADPSDTFLGQDRSLDPVYLGGVRIVSSAATDGTIERTLIRAGAEAQVHGARPDVGFMNPLDFGVFLNELGTRVQYNTVMGRIAGKGSRQVMVDVGITAVRVMLPTGPCDIMPDVNCQRNTCWLLDTRTWGWYGLGMTAFEWAVDDGAGKFLRLSQSDIDGVEANRRIYGQIGCTSPGCNIRIDLTDVLS